MVQRSPSRRQRDHRRRGSVYLLVLAVSGLVMIIGMSAVAATRIQQRGQLDEAHAAEAQVLADAALQIALERLVNDPNWRDTYTHEQWTGWEALGDGGFTFKLEDLNDTALDDDDEEPFRLTARATRGEAVRLVSIEVEALEVLGPELVTNGDMEAGSAGYGRTALAGNINGYSDSPHGGNIYLAFENRFTQLDAWKQDLPNGDIETDKTYRCTVWMRLPNTPEDVKIGLYTSQGFSIRYVDEATPAGTTWTKVTADLTPDFSFTPDLTYVYGVTVSGNQTIHFDDLSVREVLNDSPFMVVRGSYRRQLDP